MKKDLKDTTFIMVVHLDSIIRLENIILTIANIIENFHTSIYILEISKYNNGILKSILQNKNIIYSFLENKDPIFHKTKYLNILAKKVTTPIIGIWDADIILDPEQIIDSVKKLRNNNYDIAYPYNGDCYETSEILRNHYFIYKDIRFLTKNKSRMKLIYTSEMGTVGGAILVKTDKYIYSGLENEEFYGWGLEDGERHCRWLEFDFHIYRNQGCIFHLTHPRDINGKWRSDYHYNKATYELNEVVNYGKKELKEKYSS